MSIEHWLMDGIVYSLAILGLICAWRADRGTPNRF